MSRQTDIWAVERFQKLRMLAMVIAITLFGLSLFIDGQWLHYLRGVAWGTAGVFSIYEGKYQKKLGHDPDAHTLRGVAFIIFGLICFWW